MSVHRRIRDTLLIGWGRTVVRHARLVVLAGLALTVLSVFVAARHLEFHGDRSDLVDADLPWNLRYARYRERFARWDDVRVVLDGDPADARIDALARSLAVRLAASPAVAEADAGYSADDASPALFRIAPDAEYASTLAALSAGRAIAAAPDAVSTLATALQQLSAGADAPDATERLRDMLAPYIGALTGDEDVADFAWLAPPRDDWIPFRSDDGTGPLRFINVQLAGNGGGIDRISADLDAVRTLVRDHVAASPLAGAVTWGVTGIPAIEADETRQSIRDSTVASIVAFVLITLLMRIAFGGVLLPLLGAVALLAGVSWAFLWVVVSVGYLQLLSVVFTVILLGLGIDFVLHIVARLEMRNNEGHALEPTMGHVFRGVGPGLLTGAVTTAAAFGATAFTDFRGMAEMGIIAAGGVLLCLVATTALFPALLALTGRWRSLIRHRECPHGHFGGPTLDRIDRHPRLVLLLAIVLVAAGGIVATGVRYDPNVLNLHPRGIESVEWEARVVEENAAGAWSALVETTPEAAPRLVAELRSLPEVGAVGGMGRLVVAAEREADIARERAAPVAVAAGGGVSELRTLLSGIRLGLASRDEPALAELEAEIAAALTASRDLGEGAWSRRAVRLESSCAAARAQLGAVIDRALTPGPLTADDLPGALRAQWTVDGSWLLIVVPAPDPANRAVLDPERLGPFVTAVRSVAADALGPPIQIHESTRLIVRAYTLAAAYAVGAILILLTIDFRSLPDALCAVLPVTIGFVGLLAVIAAFGVPLNFANIIVLPLIFGIGVDAGVHIVHRWRHEPHLRPAGLGGGTGRGVLLTMLTTMIGFGCMLIAHHRGIRSLGFVMIAGLAVTLAACMTVLPAVLRLRPDRAARTA